MGHTHSSFLSRRWQACCPILDGGMRCQSFLCLPVIKLIWFRRTAISATSLVWTIWLNTVMEFENFSMKMHCHSIFALRRSLMHHSFPSLCSRTRQICSNSTRSPLRDSISVWNIVSLINSAVALGFIVGEELQIFSIAVELPIKYLSRSSSYLCY